MKNIIKKLLLILIMLSARNNAFSLATFDVNINQDYLITSDKTVQSIKIDNPDVLTISTFFTIFNEKNVLLIHPKKIGKTNIILTVDNKKIIFNAVVKQKDAANTFHCGDFDIMQIDEPPAAVNNKIESMLNFNLAPRLFQNHFVHYQDETYGISFQYKSVLEG